MNPFVPGKQTQARLALACSDALPDALLQRLSRHSIRRLASLPAVQAVPFPRFRRYYRALTHFQPPFVAFALAVPHGASGFRSRCSRTQGQWAGDTLCSATPTAAVNPVGTAGSPKFPGNLDCCYARFFDPGRPANSSPIWSGRLTPAERNGEAAGFASLDVNKRSLWWACRLDVVARIITHKISRRKLIARLVPSVHPIGERPFEVLARNGKLA